MNTIKFALLSETAKIPTRKHLTDAGIDLYADLYYNPIKEDHLILPWVEGREALIDANSVVVVGTGVCVEIPTNYFGFITNKSGSDFLVGGGIVDQGYQGELLVKIFNPLDKPLVISHGQKIAQLLIIPCLTLEVESVDLKDIYTIKTDRGASGGITKSVARRKAMQAGFDPENYLDWLAKQDDEKYGDPFHYGEFDDDDEYLKWRSEQGGMP